LTGARGPSDVYSASKATGTAPVPIAGAGSTTVLSLSVPAGVYLAEQSVQYFYGGTAGDAYCLFGGPGATTIIANGADILGYATLASTTTAPTTSAHGVITVTAASTLTLTCAGPAGAGVQRATVTALAVGAAH